MADWERIEEGVLGAAEIPSGEREAWLEQFCGSDPDLRAEIESLLKLEPQAEKFLETPASGLAMALNAHPAAAMEGILLGPYKVVKRLAHGGMGSVFLAVRADREFNKRVAIKVLRRGMDTEEILRRFRQERQILAALEHPNIARLIDAGMSSEGMPYIVMEFVEGEPLDRYCGNKELGPDERLKLFLKVCSAVSYAHQNLVVHRDLKPSNILITKDGEPKLLDFGIAKLLNPELSSNTIAPTATYLRLMTPEYASPEQIQGKNITTASDVYSLGVVLYKLLTGQNPHRFQNTSPQEIERVVCQSEPSRPSEVLRTLPTTANGHSGTLRQFASSLRGDLDNIVLTALRKEPERRYKSVADLADDIERHLAGRPVSARPNTFKYRTGKFVRRHKVGVAAASMVLLAVVSATGFSIFQARVARRERDIARAERAKAERVSQFLAAALQYSNPAAAVAGTGNKRDATINEMLDDIAPKLVKELADEPEVRSSLQRTVGTAYISQLRLADAEKYLNAALETQRQLYGDDNPEVALTMVRLGEAQTSAGDFVNGESSLSKAIAIYRADPPTDDIHLGGFADSYIYLGALHWSMGRYDAAEAAYSSALEVAARVSGDRRPLAQSKLGLGLTRYAKGHLEQAVELLRGAVAEMRANQHMRWDLPEALNGLGQVLTWKGNYDEAISVLQESEELSRSIWGNEGTLVARSLYLKTYALCFKGECREAEAPLAECERIYEKTLPGNKIVIANNLDARSIIYTRTGRLTEGESFARRSVELYAASVARGSASLTLARLHLAENLIAQRKFGQAEAILVQAYKDASEVQGKEHWRTRAVADALASLYDSTGRSELAGEYKHLK